MLGIAVVAADTAHFSCFYSTNNGTSWTPLGAVSKAGARLLAEDTDSRVYCRPNPDLNGTFVSALTFRAWDRTSGAEGGLASTAFNGGTSAFSAATDTVALTVHPVNDAPKVTVAAGGSCGADDGSGTINLTVADVDNAAGT